MNKADRIKWIDYAKSIGIFCVVLLHVHCDDLTVKIINAFVMPLFFIVSGYLFSYTANGDYGKFMWKRFRQLVVPYLWIGLLSYVLWLLFLRNYGSNPMDDVIWYVPLVGTLAGIPSMLVCNIPIWSLLAFFVVEMVYYPLGRWLKSPVYMVVISLAVMIVANLLINPAMASLPLVIGPSIAGVFFYSVGHAARHYKILTPQGSPYGYAILGAAIFYLALTFNDEISFYTCNYHNIWLFILSSIAGSAVVIWVATVIARVWYPKLIIFISDTTLLICGFHLLIFAAVKGVAYFALGISPEELTAGIGRGFAFAVVCFALSLPVSYIITRYFRFLVFK